MNFNKIITIKRVAGFGLILACVFIGSNSYFDYRLRSTYSRNLWNSEAQMELLSALRKELKQGAQLTDGPYWGPVTPSMAQKIKADPKYVIDPYNLDGPRSKWITGPKYEMEDHGWPVRIKGNPFWLYSNGQNFYLFIGRGVDGVQQITIEDARATEKGRASLDGKAYDPTNGYISGGDIYHLEQFDDVTSATIDFR